MLMSCSKDEDVKGYWVFTTAVVTEYYPPFAAFGSQTDRSSYSRCGMTQSEAGAYSIRKIRRLPVVVLG